MWEKYSPPFHENPGLKLNTAGALSRQYDFTTFAAIVNLADKSDGTKVRISVDGTSAEGFDPSWLRNAVDEPLDERIQEEWNR
ncbi:MAG: hypothetical protein KJ936_01680 [Proteobacteria bacterium]|nr:hypothetical protein [Pseudomonadota bacterium]MBU2226377.1 hypothetical protein [Pseudomonadota bacterium]